MKNFLKNLLVLICYNELEYYNKLNLPISPNSLTYLLYYYER